MKLVVLLLFLLMLFMPITAYAESESWTALEPKPMGDNSRCTGRADYGGHQYTYTNWVPADSNAGWRAHYCRSIVLPTDMKMWYSMRGVSLPDSAIVVVESPQPPQRKQ